MTDDNFVLRYHYLNLVFTEVLGRNVKNARGSYELPKFILLKCDVLIKVIRKRSGKRIIGIISRYS